MLYVFFEFNVLFSTLTVIRIIHFRFKKSLRKKKTGMLYRIIPIYQSQHKVSKTLLTTGIHKYNSNIQIYNDKPKL